MTDSRSFTGMENVPFPHEVYCNADRRLEIGCDACSCRAGREIKRLRALLAQRIEHEPFKLGVEGSNPSERTSTVAQAEPNRVDLAHPERLKALSDAADYVGKVGGAACNHIVQGIMCLGPQAPGTRAAAYSPQHSRALLDFFKWAMREGPWDGGDLDGGGVQDKAESLGLIVKTQYDPEKHGTQCDFEAGDDYFEFAPGLSIPSTGGGPAA